MKVMIATLEISQNAEVFVNVKITGEYSLISEHNHLKIGTE